MDWNPAVVYDACVLFPAPLLRLLVELAAEAQDLGLFRRAVYALSSRSNNWDATARFE